MPKRFDPRQNMNRSTFEIFHYLDPSTRHMEAHYHDFYEVFFFIDGDVDYWIDGSLYRLAPGDILLIHPTELHKPVPAAKIERYERIVLWINKSYLSEIENGILENCFDKEKPTYNKVLRLAEDKKEQLFALAHSLCEEYHSSEFAAETGAYSLLLQILVQINRHNNTETPVDSKKFSTPTLISEILSYINDHYAEKLTLDSIANHFFVSKYHLSHEFKDAVNTSLYRYIIMKRLNEAYTLLSEGHSANDVCTMCGFGNYSVFFRAFKAEFGISPVECSKQ
ncbi:MAG: helix-turn-helix domain-containing protein [Clostridia bacterium]|nr:helix-turn-helix domain-containing protein [Clostridia bacterium]